jgi:hypothetical protein
MQENDNMILQCTRLGQTFSTDMAEITIYGPHLVTTLILGLVLDQL